MTVAVTRSVSSNRTSGLIWWRYAAAGLRRQHRSALISLMGLYAALLVSALLVGLDAHSTEKRYLACGHCMSAANYFQQKPFGLYPTAFSIALVIGPLLVGVFLGAPLIASEIETGTYRFTWTQAVGRSRWIVGRLCLLALALSVVSAVTSAVFVWSVGPFAVVGVTSRWDPLLFGASPLVLVGWSALAVSAGALIGCLTRRTITAMTITGLVLAALFFGTVLRFDNLMLSISPDSTTTAPIVLSGAWINPSGQEVNAPPTRQIGPLQGSWLLTAKLVALDGQPVSSRQEVYMNEHIPPQGLAKQEGWLSRHRERLAVTYQPAGRLWLFQGGVLMVLLLVSSGIALLTLRKTVSA